VHKHLKLKNRDKPTAGKPELGDVGYEFRKEFNTGWYTGKVVETRPLAGKKSYKSLFAQLYLYNVHIICLMINPYLFHRKWIRP